VLRLPFSWDVALRHRVIALDVLTHEDEASRFYETSGISCPLMRRHIPDQRPPLHCCEGLLICSYLGTVFSGIMNDGWISDDENLTQYSPVSSQTFGRGGSRRGRGTGRGHENWWGGGRGNYKSNNKFGAPENGQVVEGGRFGRQKGRYRGGGNFRENSSGDGNVDMVGSCSESIITVKSADVGKIIGKGGCKIREFEEESGARIQVCDT